MLFLMRFLKVKCGQYWVKIPTNMFAQNSEKQKTMGTKILLNCWVRVLTRTLVHDWINGKIQVRMKWRYFVAHLIVMGILKKNSLEQYWSRDSILNTPFFGHYMFRNHFQNILWNLHVSDLDETNPPKGEADHDPLFLVRPMVDMMQRNFLTKYRPGKELSLDESMCPFKGRVHFKCYNPKKPNRFHIKLFMVSEPSTGYICGFGSLYRWCIWAVTE